MTILVLIVVLQVCTTSNAIIPGKIEPDVTKLFPSDELQRARNAGTPDAALITGMSFGLTIDEMIQLQPFRSKPDNVTFELVDKVCKILLPGGQKASTNFTSAHEIHMVDLVQLMRGLPNPDQTVFSRTIVCAYISEPDSYERDASKFGLPFVPYMGIRFFKMKAENATSVERVKLTKEICCVLREPANNPGYLRDQSNFSSLPDKELDEFDKSWIKFEAENTLKAFESVCDFLLTKNPSSECRRSEPVDEEQ